MSWSFPPRQWWVHKPSFPKCWHISQPCTAFEFPILKDFHNYRPHIFPHSSFPTLLPLHKRYRPQMKIFLSEILIGHWLDITPLHNHSYFSISISCTTNTCTHIYVCMTIRHSSSTLVLHSRYQIVSFCRLNRWWKEALTNLFCQHYALQISLSRQLNHTINIWACSIKHSI